MKTAQRIQEQDGGSSKVWVVNGISRGFDGYHQRSEALVADGASVGHKLAGSRAIRKCYDELAGPTSH